MKKIAIIILLGIYTISTFGIGVSRFYCCGNLTTIHFVYAHHDKATTEKAKSGCCQTNYQFNKVDDNHAAAVEISSPAKYFTFIDLFIPAYKNILVANQEINSAANSSHAPPQYSSLPIFIFDCVYRL